MKTFSATVVSFPNKRKRNHNNLTRLTLLVIWHNNNNVEWIKCANSIGKIEYRIFFRFGWEINELFDLFPKYIETSLRLKNNYFRILVAKHSCAFVGGVGSLRNRKKINYAREKSSSNYSTLVIRIEGMIFNMLCIAIIAW